MSPSKQLEFPYELEKVGEEDLERYARLYGDEGGAQEFTIKEIGLAMAKWYVPQASRIYNMEVRSDDIWLVTYPKCGTTWTQEIIWNMVNNCPESEIQLKQPLFQRFPFMEFQTLHPGVPLPSDPTPKDLVVDSMFNHSIGSVERMASPRLIKTHLPFEVLPPDLLTKAKVVYVARNPWDAAASFYHHATQVFDFVYKFKGDFKDFANLFKNSEFQYGSYWHHVKSAWKVKDHPNMHYMWYEDMKTDLDTELNKLQDFFGISLDSDKMEKLKHRVSIDTMKKTVGDGMDAFKTFFNRNGQTTSNPKQAFKQAPELVEEWEAWIEHHLQDTDLPIRIQHTK